MERLKLLALGALVFLLPNGAVAGLASTMVQDAIVFRVSPSGKPEIVGQLFKNDAIDIIGYRPNFEWVRIKYENDEGYVLKEAIQDPDLDTEYFDPKADQLGRRGAGGNYEAALTKAMTKKTPGASFSGIMTMNSATKFGLGAGFNYGVFSWETSGYQFGADGVLYFRTPGTPFISSFFARYWTPGEQKFGMELFASLNFVRVETNTKTTTDVSSSYGFGAVYALPLSKKIAIVPGVRLNLNEDWGIGGILGLNLSL